MPPTQRAGSGSTAPDDKSDARHPDTAADKRSDSPATHPTDLGVDETDADVNARYGFSTIDTSDVDHSKAEIKPAEQVDQVSGSAGASVSNEPTSHRNSTFAQRAAERDKRSNTRVSQATSK